MHTRRLRYAHAYAIDDVYADIREPTHVGHTYIAFVILYTAHACLYAAGARICMRALLPSNILFAVGRSIWVRDGGGQSEVY